MTILTLVSEYPSWEDQIPNTFVHKYLKALKKTGADVYVLLMDFRSIRRKRPLGLSSYEYDGIKIYRYAFPCGPVPNLLEYLMKKNVNKLFKYAMKFEKKPDVIHAHFGTMGYIANALKKRYNIPYIVTEHSSSLMYENVRNAQKYKYYLQGYSGASKIISVSSELKKVIDRFSYPNISSVIPNVLGKDFKKIEIDKETMFTVVSVGNLCHRKRFDLLINAIGKINQQGLDVQLWIVGAGNLRKELEVQAVGLDIGQRVKFFGNKRPDELCVMFNRAHIFALPSDAETFGVVYIEANACGLPVIATDCGGPSDIVNETNGVIIPKNDYEALANAIVRMREKYDEYDSQMISKNALEQYGEKTIVKEYINIYEETINDFR